MMKRLSFYMVLGIGSGKMAFLLLLLLLLIFCCLATTAASNDTNVSSSALGESPRAQEPLPVHRSKLDVHKISIPQVKERTCSLKLGVSTDKEVCNTVLLRTAKITGELLVRELAETDKNYVVRRIHIMTHEPDALVINTALDVFLVPRPWWIIRKEHFLDLNHSHASVFPSTFADSSSTPTNTTHGRGGRASAGSWAHIFLQRYEIKLEPHMHQISAVQFPPSNEECASSRLKLSHTVNSGWGSASAFYGIFVTDYPWAVFAPYESNTNKASEKVMYASEDLCPTIVNKWTCAFMPTTNCTLPDAVTKCQEGACKWDGDLLFSSASSEGKRLTDAEKGALPDVRDKQTAASAYHKKISEWYQPFRSEGFQAENFLNSKREITLAHRPDKGLVSKVFGQIWRPNAVYRTLISRRIDTMWTEMFEQYGIPPLVDEKYQCTAIHIRRGDRSINFEGEGMRTWCKQWLPFKTWDNCTSHTTGQTMACQTISDYGCFSNNPFGALTLNDYLNASLGLLPNSRNVFVLTDASAWLQKERKTVDKAWNIYSIASNGGKDRSNDAPRATMNGVEYHASVKVAQSCHAFVGHWGSGVSHMIYNAMCWRHGHSVLGHCPPAIDMA